MTLSVGKSLAPGSKLRIGLPNTGWEQPVVPQHRYWDELVQGEDRRYAPFHPVNTTAEVRTAGRASVTLDVMERMLLPDEDPAEAYWRWWITAMVESASLEPGDEIVLTYGDPRFVGRAARVQTFPEADLTVSAYVDSGDGNWLRPAGAPAPIDVIAGPAVRANVVVPSIAVGNELPVKIALTDACHCSPQPSDAVSLSVRRADGDIVGEASVKSDAPATVTAAPAAPTNGGFIVAEGAPGRIWGRSNPSEPLGDDGLQLFWGDLHAQSEYHVMHSQKKDARQKDWSKGISCGTPDEVYRYARDTSLLDFVAITDQGAITGVGWDLLQQKAAEFYEPQRFVTFNAYEAGSPVGHRNVIYRGADVDGTQRAEQFNYMPKFLYEYYRGRDDVMMIPHHVKTWTDWSFYDPQLEPVMEVYSCWGQSESPSTERWNKGMTPGAGAWEALGRGYRLGIIASSDNHVGMPGRSYPHDRQAHTPFPGGLVGVWAAELTREAIFDAIRARRCYGTTGARLIVRFTVNGLPMGSEATLDSADAPREISVSASGAEGIASIEILRNGQVAHREDFVAGEGKRRVHWEDPSKLNDGCYYYARVTQNDGETAWSSPVWIDLKS